MSRNVVAFPGEANPEDALKFITEALHSGRLIGVAFAIVTTSEEVENLTEVDVRVCGDVVNGDLVWAGTKLIKMGTGG